MLNGWFGDRLMMRCANCNYFFYVFSLWLVGLTLRLEHAGRGKFQVIEQGMALESEEGDGITLGLKID